MEGKSGCAWCGGELIEVSFCTNKACSRNNIPSAFGPAVMWVKAFAFGDCWDSTDGEYKYWIYDMKPS